MRMILQVIAVIAILMGLLWIGQGTGVVKWPSSSFMLAQKQWAINGVVLALVGLVLFLLARRR